jgi:predicted nucleotidyltransferase
MTDAPEQVAVSAIHEEMHRIRLRVPSSRWFVFGSIATGRRPVGDIDVLVVCKTTTDCTTVRDELAQICAWFPIHLLLMTQSEESEVRFIKTERAVEMAPAR